MTRRYVLLLRGVNVGGKHKVNMGELKARLTERGFANVISYINSGNLIFDAEQETPDVRRAVAQMLKAQYAFDVPFALIEAEDYRKTVDSLPDWWRNGGMARRDALFFTEGMDPAHVAARIGRMTLHSEIVHHTEIAVFWGKIDKKEYMKTAYHKKLLAEDFYKRLTIRNGNTVEKIAALL